jgi:HAD superfamily hydrolase (TIGR01490 family)
MEQKVRSMVASGARALVQKHRDNGDLMVIITATNSFVTAPIAREFGVEHLIGTTPEEVDGQFTGRVSGIPSFKEGKVTRLLQWLENRGQTLQSFDASWFYSDSHNDLPLMKLVDHPVAVDADPRLREYATANGWPVISLR